MLKYTKHNLKKLEAIFEQLDYVIRYEKGHFQSGYCVVEHKKVLVINKFYKTDARIQCMIEILRTLTIDNELLDNKQQQLIQQIQQAND